jgi:homoserine O-succinyltransferase/O-acetyltransferase
MPLIIEGGRVPPRWAEQLNSRKVVSIDSFGPRASVLRVAFVNNMPDAALEDTECQFFELLDAAAGDLSISVKLYSLTGVPREERGRQHLQRFYFGVEDLLNSRFDGLIMTGTEPRQSNLRNEPYWSSLASVLDWAETNTASSILSCLAAHAGVLYSDGISRRPLSDKKFGVFDFSKDAVHPLLAETGQSLRFPHSRWNEVPEEALIDCGYQILTKSAEDGVDSFAKKKKHSLFLHFQGHPEYGCQTLLKEYRRDIKRFLRGERETYPAMPRGYFDEGAATLLRDFREAAEADPREQVMLNFPETTITASLRNTWHASAVRIYRNWVRHLEEEKSQTQTFPAMAAAYDQSTRKRSARP